MENTSLIALSRQGTLRRHLNIIANNLANMNTTGFKAKKMMFIEHLTRSEGGDGIAGQPISFVRDIATMRDTAAGTLKETGNPLDMAIRGPGYFVVETEDGERYTRNGHFRLDEAGQLVTQGGHPVLSDSGQPFFFSPEDSEIKVAPDGTVSTENGELGRIRVVRFENDQELQDNGGGLLASEKPPADVEAPDVAQNMLENSNVQPIMEIARMIAVERAYSDVKRFIAREDERIRTMMRELNRPV
ncbi:MAG: flagellar basal-body rod protein FlgF [Proteobacteria bacterium]|nr:flagellar basal-body rod protein FlgF [Pseudomonadota bacterium]